MLSFLHISVSTCDTLLLDARSSLPSFVGRPPLFHYKSNCTIFSPTTTLGTLTTGNATLSIAPSVLAAYHDGISSNRPEDESVVCRVSVVAENFLGAQSDPAERDIVISVRPLQLNAVMREVPPDGLWSRSQVKQFVASGVLTRSWLRWHLF